MPLSEVRESGGRESEVRESEVRRRPTLLNSCASAATAAEARFRIDDTDYAARASRIIALDEGAAGIVARLTEQHWRGGHFLIFDATVSTGSSAAPLVDAMLRTADGSMLLLSEEVTDADLVVMVATEDASAEAASMIGDACARQMTMSVGLVVSATGDTDRVVSALRPNAMVLAILKDETEISPILTALRV
jgi:hypothetical protein